MLTEKELKKMRDLGVTEIVFGSICVITGIEVAVFNGVYAGPHGVYTSGEGIWCGMWIIVAGAFGILASRSSATEMQRKLHLLFCVIGVVFTLIMLVLGIIFLALVQRFQGPLELVVDSVFSYPVIYTFGFISLILLIVSINDTSKALKYCCYKEAYNDTEHPHSGRFNNIPLSETPTLPVNY